MAGLLLWIPATELNKRAVDVFAAAGLADMLDPRDAMPAVTEELVAGPDGGRGMLWHWHADGDRQPMPLVRKDAQNWYECKPRGGLPKGRAWIGYETKNPPRPCDLERTKPHPGVPHCLADGREWTVPLVRELPQIIGFDDDGNVSSRFNVDRYQRVFDQTWEICERLSEAVAVSQASGEPARYTVNRLEYFQYVAELLGLNYRLNVDVLDAMGLMSTSETDVLPGLASGYYGPQKKS
jgi:hypothetical protein